MQYIFIDFKDAHEGLRIPINRYSIFWEDAE
jgi:hypothetical protein